jgi:hypothetical protein
MKPFKPFTKSRGAAGQRNVLTASLIRSMPSSAILTAFEASTVALRLINDLSESGYSIVPTAALEK